MRDGQRYFCSFPPSDLCRDVGSAHVRAFARFIQGRPQDRRGETLGQGTGDADHSESAVGIITEDHSFHTRAGPIATVDLRNRDSGVIRKGTCLTGPNFDADRAATPSRVFATFLDEGVPASS